MKRGNLKAQAIELAFRGSVILGKIDKRTHRGRIIFACFTMEELQEIERKRIKRDRLKWESVSEWTRIKESLAWYKSCKGTSYFKVPIIGGRNIWWCNPVYGHLDYNKSIMCANDDRGRKIAYLITKILYN